VTVQLYHGDCLDVLPTLPESSVDLIVTDPPYFKVKDLPWDRQWDTAAGYLAWLDRVLAEFYRVLAPNGSLYLFASPRMAARVELAVGERFEVLNHITWAKAEADYAPGDQRATAFRARDVGASRKWMPFSERIIFAEHIGADGYAKGESGWGRKCDELRGFVFEPLRAYLAGERDRAGITSRQVDKYLGNYMSGHYFGQSQWTLPTRDNYEAMRRCFHDLNGGGEYLRREYEDLRREYEDLRRPFAVTADVPYTDVWTFPTVQAYPGKHPCEKPLEMLEHIVRASSREGATVLDAFMGSGNTGKAAQGLGRSFIGIELSEHWHQVAGERIGTVQLEMAI